MVARAVERYLTLYNAVRPHEAIGFRPPLTAWQDFDAFLTPNLFGPESVSLS